MLAQEMDGAEKICKAQKRVGQGSEKRTRYGLLGSAEVGDFSRSCDIIRYRLSNHDLNSTYELHNC
jgi:hypothetical protein